MGAAWRHMLFSPFTSRVPPRPISSSFSYPRPAYLHHIPPCISCSTCWTCDCGQRQRELHTLAWPLLCLYLHLMIQSSSIDSRIYSFNLSSIQPSRQRAIRAWTNPLRFCNYQLQTGASTLYPSLIQSILADYHYMCSAPCMVPMGLSHNSSSRTTGQMRARGQKIVGEQGR